MTSGLEGVRGLLERAVPFLRDEGARYEDDGSNEPLELARSIEAELERTPPAAAQQQGQAVAWQIRLVAINPKATGHDWRQISKEQYDREAPGAQGTDFRCEYRELYTAPPPSVPVGVEDGPIDASDNAEYIEHCADRLERCGLRVTAGALRVIAHEHRALAQQPAAVSADATAARDAEIEALRAEVKEARRIAIEHADARAFADDRANMAEARVERLEGALQRLVNSFPEEGVLLDAGWDGCEVDEACEAYDAARAALEQEAGRG